MRRLNAQLQPVDLPLLDLAKLGVDEMLYLRHMLGMIETGDMFHGRFVEVHVAALLGADIADRGITPWDLRIPGRRPITVEVKTTMKGGSFRIQPKAADVWVFVAHTGKAVRPRTFTYAVAPGHDVAKCGVKQMRQSKVFAKWGEVDAEKLPAAVKRAATAKSA